MPCRYKDLFGKVGEGVHSYRVLHIAIVDVACTVFAAYLLHAYFPRHPFAVYLVGLFILGVVVHRILCVRTTVDRLIFG